MKILRVLFVVLSFGISFSGYAEPLPAQCVQECVIEFGAHVGTSFSKVQAYSNCNNKCVNPMPNFVAKVYTGIKWQCVEYARRWLLVNQGVVYGDVDIAADIWNVDYVNTPAEGKRFALQGIVNGSSNETPRRGDLLIYSSQFLGTGHVAVVLRVDEDKQQVLVGEQNYNNQAWQHEYARAIPYIERDNSIWLLDGYLIGWKRVIY